MSLCNAQTDTLNYPNDLNEWVEKPLPLSYMNAHRLSENGDKWQLYVEDSIVKAKLLKVEIERWTTTGDIPPIPLDNIFNFGDITSLKVNNGYLVGAYRGEFAENFYHIGFSGEKQIVKRYINIIDIFKENNQYYALSGLTHLGVIDEGSLLILRQDETGTWFVKKRINLPEKPYRYINHNGSLFIITSSHIVCYNADEELVTILKSPVTFGYLGIYSVLIHEKDMYIGLGGGVLKISNILDQTYCYMGGNWKMQWFQNPKIPVNTKKTYIEEWVESNPNDNYLIFKAH